MDDELKDNKKQSALEADQVINLCLADSFDSLAEKDEIQYCLLINTQLFIYKVNFLQNQRIFYISSGTLYKT